MGNKMGFAVGMGIGYVLGAKAGRQRYEDLRRWYQQIAGNPNVQRAAERTKDVATEGAKKGLTVVQQGMEKAGSAVKERLHKEESSDTFVDLSKNQPSKQAGTDYSR